MKKISIVGAGLAGCLLALYLARLNFKITLYERRPDPRVVPYEEGRSINLALSARGIRALKELNISDEVLQHSIPMVGRMIHPLVGTSYAQLYGLEQAHHINSISRDGLNIYLLGLLDQHEHVQLKFLHQVGEVDFDALTMQVHHLSEQTRKIIATSVISDHELIIASDSATSHLRRQFVTQKNAFFAETMLTHSYKELTIQAPHSHELAKNYLHIWPRSEFMLIALPNMDDSWTCTLFLPTHGAQGFDHLTTTATVNSFFTSYFPDAMLLMPNLTSEFLANPVGSLISVQGEPWSYRDRFLLIGDSAHAMVPFFGQGMNCAFEDCFVLSQCIKRYLSSGFEKVFTEFYLLRKNNTDAIMSMSFSNYQEMRAQVLDPSFLLKKEVEKRLMQKYPNHYIPQYHLVSFYCVPYSYAKHCGELQQELLAKLVTNLTDIFQLNWTLAEALIDEYVKQTQLE
jgi:kynurenine 3-monooxygenase